jgi:glycosyltransferase involved in cell wall biosynthesis
MPTPAADSTRPLGLRIAHVSDCYLPRMGGIERQVDGLSAAQAARGDTVDVITSVAFDGDSGSRDDRLLGGPPVTVRRPGRLRAPGSISYRSSVRGSRLVLDGDYDVVHIHASTFSPLAYLAARAATRAGIATVVTTHSFWSYATPIFQAAHLVLGWRDWPITWSAVSRVAAEELSSVLGPGRPVSVLPNGVSAGAWRTEATSLEDDPVRIVTVMRLAKRKRPMEFLAMLRSLRSGTPAAVRLDVRIVGDGPKRLEMADYLRRYGMSSWVHLDGQLSPAEIREALGQSHFYVAPARLESFGIAALEAHCAGLPVIAFARSGISDIVEHRRTGLLVADDAGMTAAMRELARNPQARRGLADNAGQADRRFDWPQILATCDDLYRHALAARLTDATSGSTAP